MGAGSDSSSTLSLSVVGAWPSRNSSTARGSVHDDVYGYVSGEGGQRDADGVGEAR